MFDFMLISTAEKLSIGGQVTLLGMGTVFAVLVVLWGLVEVLHLLLAGPSKKKKVVKVVEEKHTPIENATAAVHESPAPAAPTTNDLDIIAVITAAVAAASGNSPSSFRVVSFKRSNNKFSGK